jgi:MFS transporter, OFA family, oxalate/formate antiporter
MPSFTADFFGAKFMGGIYGIILLAWGAAAIPSPIMIARLHRRPAGSTLRSMWSR